MNKNLDMEKTEKILNLITQFWNDEEDSEDPVYLLEFIERQLQQHHEYLCESPVCEG